MRTRRMRTIPVGALLALAAPLIEARPQDSGLDSGLPLPPEQACYDVLHYDLSLRVDPEKRTIAGACTMRARMLSASESILVDLDGRLEVASVRLGDEDAR